MARLRSAITLAPAVRAASPTSRRRIGRECTECKAPLDPKTYAGPLCAGCLPRWKARSTGTAY